MKDYFEVSVKLTLVRLNWQQKYFLNVLSARVLFRRKKNIKILNLWKQPTILQKATFFLKKMNAILQKSRKFLQQLKKN